MILALLTFITALLMEGIGSYMSVVGWNSILVGDWVVIALFVVLDIAKIISVSFLYQTWTEIKKTWRAYLLFAVVFLMVLTSAGSFGYLSSSFQKAMAPNKEVTLQIKTSTLEKEQLTEEKKQLIISKTKIEDQIAKLPSDYVSGRTRLISNFKEETRNINSRISKIDNRLNELNSIILNSSKVQLEKDVHVGPIVYFANAFNMAIEQVVSIAILSVIFVFDPLAISLILAGNFLINRRRKQKDLEKEQKNKLVEPIQQKIEEPKVKEINVKKSSLADQRLKSVLKRQERIEENEKPIINDINPIGGFVHITNPPEMVSGGQEKDITKILLNQQDENISPPEEKKTLTSEIIPIIEEDLQPLRKEINGQLEIGQPKIRPILKNTKEDIFSTETDPSNEEWKKKSSYRHFYSRNEDH